jgi:hypothetical protein
MREYNRANGIPECVVVYPQPDDARSVVRYQRRFWTVSGGLSD